MELLIGCGHDRGKRFLLNGQNEWKQLVTLDINDACKPDVINDLEANCLPFKSSTFDELHAYEVLEHLGTQGDWKFFFAEFDEFARVLKPGGYLFITSPHVESRWLWGDPGHRRYIGPELITFLVREQYAKQQGKTTMTDYRQWFSSDWALAFMEKSGESNVMVLENRKEN